MPQRVGEQLSPFWLDGWVLAGRCTSLLLGPPDYLVAGLLNVYSILLWIVMKLWIQLWNVMVTERKKGLESTSCMCHGLKLHQQHLGLFREQSSTAVCKEYETCRWLVFCCTSDTWVCSGNRVQLQSVKSTKHVDGLFSVAAATLQFVQETERNCSLWGVLNM